MILHAVDAVRDGFHKTMVSTVDTDVVVLVVARMRVEVCPTEPPLDLES